MSSSKLINKEVSDSLAHPHLKSYQNPFYSDEQHCISGLFKLYEKQLEDLINDAVILLDKDFTILRWNKASEVLYEWKAEEVMGRQLGEIIPTHYTNAQQTETLSELFATGCWKGEVIQKSKSKKKLYIYSSLFTVKSPEGFVQGIAVVNRSISDQKKSQQSLILANQHLNFHINNTPLGYIQWDHQFRLETWSSQAEKIFGWKIEEVHGKTVYDSSLIHQDDVVKFTKAIIEVLEKGTQRFKFTTRCETKDGKVLYCEWYHSVLRDQDGKLISILSFVDDISERIMAAREMRTSNRQLRHIFSSVQDCIWCIEKGEGYVAQKYVSPSITTITGRSSREISHSFKNWMKLIHPEDLELFKKGCKKIFSGKFDHLELEYRIIYADGSVRWVSDSIKIRKKGKKLVFYGLLRDVTHKVEHQKKLEESERKVRNIAESAPGILFQYTHKNGTDAFDYMSKETIEPLGISKKGLNENLGKVWTSLVENDIEGYREKIKKSEKELSKFEYEFRLKGDHKVKWLRAVAHPELNLRDGSVKWTGIIMDITDQQKVMQDLERRNFELSNFSYKVSHDLRAPLCSVKGLVGLIRNETNPSVLAGYLDMIENSIDRLDQFVLNTLSHTKVTHNEVVVQPINFEEIINDIFAEMSNMPLSDRVEKMMDLSIKSFHSDEVLMKEIFRNLISNSIKYQDTRKEKSFIKISLNTDAENMYLECKDNGMGIENDQLPKIFGMFYKGEQSKGSGIGLYIAKQAIDKLQGKIEVKSQFNQGTTFSIVLPKKISF